MLSNNPIKVIMRVPFPISKPDRKWNYLYKRSGRE